MNKLRIIWIALILMIASGCQTTLKDERANLKAVSTVYTSLLKQLSALRKAGKLSNDDFAHAKLISAVISKNIDLCNDALQSGKKSPDLADVIDKNVRILAELLIKHKETE